VKYDISDMREAARLLGISEENAKEVLSQMSDDQYVNFMSALANSDNESAMQIAKGAYNNDVFENVSVSDLYESVNRSLNNGTNITPVFFFVPIHVRESVVRQMYPSQCAKLLSKLKGFSIPVFEANMRMADITTEIEKICTNYNDIISEALPAIAAVSKMQQNSQQQEEDDEDTVVVPTEDKKSVTKAKIVQDMGNSMRVKTADGRTKVVNKRDAADYDAGRLEKNKGRF